MCKNFLKITLTFSNFAWYNTDIKERYVIGNII